MWRESYVGNFSSSKSFNSFPSRLMSVSPFSVFNLTDVDDGGLIDYSLRSNL